MKNAKQTRCYSTPPLLDTPRHTVLSAMRGSLCLCEGPHWPHRFHTCLPLIWLKCEYYIACSPSPDRAVQGVVSSTPHSPVFHPDNVWQLGSKAANFHMQKSTPRKLCTYMQHVHIRPKMPTGAPFEQHAAACNSQFLDHGQQHNMLPRPSKGQQSYRLLVHTDHQGVGRFLKGNTFVS